MIAATALSYLASGFVGAVVLIFFGLKSAQAFKLVTAPRAEQAPEAVDAQGRPAPVGSGLGFAIPPIVYLALLAGDGLTWATRLLIGCAMLIAVGLWVDSRRSSRWNYLDRVDGFMAVRCLLFCAGVQVLTGGIPGWIGDLTWLLAGSVLGLLVYNWPPAKIRLGNAGTAVLGLLIVTIAVQVWRNEQLPLVACLILLAGFWFDATYTGCVRMFTTRARTANRSHVDQALYPSLYQSIYRRMAARKGLGWMITAYVAFAICWLLPLSKLTLLYPQLELLWLVVAVAPMGVASEFLNAGKPASDEV